MKKIFFFSENLNKINEIKILFKKNKIELLDLKNFYNINIPEETGKTFEENARIKSYYGFKNSNYPCFADDSGLCINSLNDFPGIKSKRFIEKNKDIKKALASIISKTKKTNSSEAYFQTSICLTLEENKSIFFNGIVKGNIADSPRGLSGFGYDPIFIPKGFKKTFGEMGIDEKNKISHRAIAINKLKEYLIKLFN